jgi:hypothetical protein
VQVEFVLKDGYPELDRAYAGNPIYVGAWIQAVTEAFEDAHAESKVDEPLLAVFELQMLRDREWLAGENRGQLDAFQDRFGRRDYLGPGYPAWPALPIDKRNSSLAAARQQGYEAGVARGLAQRQRTDSGIDRTRDAE